MAAAGRVYAIGAGLAVVLVVQPGLAGLNTWTPLGPEGGHVDAIAVAASDPRIAYAANDLGFFKTVDGAHWLPTLSRRVTAVAVDPRNASTVYAGGQGEDYQGVVLRSDDGGVTWGNPVSASSDLIVGLVVDPQDSDTVYALDSYEAAAVSHDRGATWRGSVLDSSIYSAIAADPHRAGTVYVGARRGVFASYDFAASWTFLPFLDDDDGVHLENVIAVVVDTDDSDVLYAAMDDGGLRRSLNAGLTWERVGSGLPTDALRSLAIDAASGMLYVGTARGLYTSADRGVSWQGTALDAHDIEPLAVAGGAPTIYAGLGVSGLMRSDDGGASFTPASAGLGGVPGTLIAGPGGALSVAADGVFHSTDGGRQWTLSAAGLPDSGISALAAHPRDAHTLYAGTVFGVSVSRDDGQTWQPTGLQYEAAPYSFSGEVRAIAVDPQDPAHMYAGTYEALFRSADAGATWQRVAARPLRDVSVSAIVVDPTHSQTVYVAADSGRCGLFKTTDGGTTWHRACPRGAMTRALAIDPHAPQTLYALFSYWNAPGTDGLYKSTDAGRSWVQIGELDYFETIAVDPQQRDRVYAAGYRSVSVSEDGGLTWQVFSAGLPSWNGGPINFAFSPTQPRTVYLATGRGAYQIERAQLCGGDCGGDGGVSIDDVIAAIATSLGAPDSACTAADRDADGRISIAELVAAVREAQDGCVSAVSVPRYAPPLLTPLPAAPLAIVTDFFDDDGDVDLALVDSHGVTSWFGDGLGGFAAGARFEVEDEVLSARHGDWDANGIPDLLIETQPVDNPSSRTLRVLLNDGDGQFGQRAAYRVSIEHSYFAFALGDVNADGIADLVTLNGGASFDNADGVFVRVGRGDGSFAPAQTYTVACSDDGDCAATVAVADVTDDGLTDVVLDTAVLPGRGDGALAAPQRGGAAPELIDLNGDGVPDSGRVVQNNLYVELGRGDGGFEGFAAFPSGGECRGSAFADLNGDGALDLVCGSAADHYYASQQSPRLSLPLNLGDAAFALPDALPAPFPPTAVAAADVNRDGRIDLLAAGGCTIWDPPSCSAGTALAVWLAR